MQVGFKPDVQDRIAIGDVVERGGGGGAERKEGYIS